MSKYLSFKYLLLSKKAVALAKAVQKIDFSGPHFGGVPGGVGPKNFGRKNCVCSSTTLRKNYISMFGGLEEEKRTRFRKKGRKKNTLLAVKSGLVGMKWYLKTYYRVKYFLPCWSRFWLRRLFTPNFRGGFWVLKPTSWLIASKFGAIASKFGANMQFINLKLQSKFHVARPNRSQVISKSLKFHTRQFENGRVKTKEHATRASIVPIHIVF